MSAFDLKPNMSIETAREVVKVSDAWIRHVELLSSHTEAFIVEAERLRELINTVIDHAGEIPPSEWLTDFLKKAEGMECVGSLGDELKGRRGG